MRERADGGCRILDAEAVQVCVERVRELREEARTAPVRPPRQQRPPARKTADGITRFGEPTGKGTAASFRCARCGELAEVIRVIRAGTPVDMGPPLGPQTHDRDGLVLDYFLGTTWRSATSGTLDAVQALVRQGNIDPVAIRELDWTFWELTPFYCPDCRLNYCSNDWDTYVLVDDGFYDCTNGRCPSGHEHMLDD